MNNNNIFQFIYRIHNHLALHRVAHKKLCTSNSKALEVMWVHLYCPEHVTQHKDGSRPSAVKACCRWPYPRWPICLANKVNALISMKTLSLWTTYEVGCPCNRTLPETGTCKIGLDSVAWASVWKPLDEVSEDSLSGGTEPGETRGLISTQSSLGISDISISMLTLRMFCNLVRKNNFSLFFAWK